MQAMGAGGEGDHYPWKVTVQPAFDKVRPSKPA